MRICVKCYFIFLLAKIGSHKLYIFIYNSSCVLDKNLSLINNSPRANLQ